MKSSIALLAAFASLVSAHMEMTDPAPLRSKYNPNTDSNLIDYSMTSPLDSTGANFPCKGYLSDSTGKESVATWAAGSSQSVTLQGSAIHEGGSCQLSISEDGGSTFKVVKSFIGNCPSSTGPVTMDFTVPSDVASGDVVFAWSWNNRVGNREFYMNCAIVTIDNGGSGLSSYPDMLVAQLSGINTCTIAEGVDVDYPNPGTQVLRADGDANIGAPTGDCGATSTSPSTSAAGTTSATASTSVAASTSSVASTSSTSLVTTSAHATTSAPATTSVASTSSAAATTSAASGACTEGEIRCDSETTWSECGSGYWQSMGSVPGGMACRDGQIVVARKRALQSHKRHWQSRAL
ncbi:hypothetical protein EV121DRAFT_267296 [Schizophyllum commune]